MTLKTIGLTTLTAAFTSLLSAQALDLNPATGWKAEAFFEDTAFGALDLLPDGNVVGFVSDAPNLPLLANFDLSGNARTNLATRDSNYTSSDGPFTSFVANEPGNASALVGFTVGGNSDDRIYRASYTGSPMTEVARLFGNYELAFAPDGTAYASANPGGSSSADNAIFRVDLSGNNNHELIAEVGGFSSGLDFDAEGNLYHATSFLDGSTEQLVRFDADDISNATAGSPLSLANDADVLAELPAGSSSVSVDDAGSVFVATNDFSNFVYEILLWIGLEEVDGGEVESIVWSNSFFFFFVQLCAEGDVLGMDGSLVGNDAFAFGVFEVTFIPEPATLTGLFGIAGLLLARRRAL